MHVAADNKTVWHIFQKIRLFFPPNQMTKGIVRFKNCCK